MDRNGSGQIIAGAGRPSLSARRAWIEITDFWYLVLRWYVALRKESVDRNNFTLTKDVPAGVALRKESVDRNIHAVPGGIRSDGRSPQGERG